MMENGSSESDADGVIEEGRELLGSGRLEEAERVFAEVLAKDGGNHLACYYLGLTAGKGGDQERSADLLRRAVALRGDFDPAREALASLLVKRGTWAPALEQLDVLLSGNRANPKLFEFAAFVCRKLGRADEAKVHLRSALALDPANPELAVALAGFRDDGGWLDPWPAIAPPAPDPFLLSAGYGRFPAESTAPTIRLARSLAGLDDPRSLPAAESGPGAPNPDQTPAPAFGPFPPADLKGVSVLFGPTVIAGVSPRMARVLRGCGARASTVEYAPSYLNYEVDFVNKSSDTVGLLKFSDEMVRKALEHDVICLDFCCSFKFLPYLGIDLRNESAKNIPYPDLHFLKDKNKKLMCFVWGSDAWSQASYHYHYLSFLGIKDIPEPPNQTKMQFQMISHLRNLVDCFVAPQYFLSVLPKTVYNWDISLEEQNWPAKVGYSDKISKILVAPTSKRKKNYDIMRSAVRGLSQKYGHVTEYAVEGKSHREVPGLYAQADLGLEQATGQFGLLAVEMMALGLPVVANFGVPDFGSFRRYAPFIKCGSLRRLVDALDACVSDPAALKPIGRACREYALQYHASTVQGRLLSGCIAKLMSNEAVDHMESPVYGHDSEIWTQDPNTVDKFRYFDISVPLFCGLGKYDYAEMDCHEAIGDGYKIDKFVAFSLAITKFSDGKSYEARKVLYAKRYGSVDVIQLSHFSNMLSSSKKLLDEAAAWMNKTNSASV